MEILIIRISYERFGMCWLWVWVFVFNLALDIQILQADSNQNNVYSER